MYIGSMVRPPGYPVDTTLTSSQARRIKGTATDITIRVGNTITISEDMKVVCLTETLANQCYLDRYFLSFNKQMFPIYIRITSMQNIQFPAYL